MYFWIVWCNQSPNSPHSQILFRVWSAWHAKSDSSRPSSGENQFFLIGPETTETHGPIMIRLPGNWLTKIFPLPYSQFRACLEFASDDHLVSFQGPKGTLGPPLFIWTRSTTYPSPIRVHHLCLPPMIYQSPLSNTSTHK